MTVGTIFNIIRYAVHDGQGIRVTFFLRGCPLRCWWCHNPESYADLEGADEGAFRTRRMSAREVIEEVEKDLVFIDESGGGATFSGGEPLMQWRFLSEVLGECRRREIHSAVDTSGYAPREAVEAVAGLADHFLYDLKLMDDAKHREFTGVSNRIILENLRFLAEQGRRVSIRVPLIPGITDTAANLDAMAEYLRTLRGIHKIHLLPYHKIAAAKYRRLEIENRLAELEPPTPEKIEAARARLAAQGFEVHVGG